MNSRTIKEFYERIEDLRTALEREKLVIFVGAGVSRNSKLPTWGQMVQVFAERIGYPSIERLAMEEYIRIPQYFYCMDESEGHSEYYKILRELIPADAKANILDELIVSLHPRHLVTTNYDNLLDQIAEDYEVIREDKQLLKGTANQYLIKMHGDIAQAEKLIFKEEDYLYYSETHRLMEVFLKSLLIDHVFLFVGYSLNDYNLKTFVSWIEYIAQEMKVKDGMHKNYFLSSSVHAEKDYLRKYYEGKGLEVINLYNLPPEVKMRAEQLPLEEDLGRRAYAVLELLKKSKTPQ
ncbi:hypothetical protein D3Z53_15445 [Lachnospiraceae bacterium]|jgi:hypothetical protein|nr:SIR2 family protein [uncultured Schaedlerella sp.]MCI9152707.1 hypothetical protein [Ruminococcus sp.]NBI59422.1 hypothetical protein [Lachnospiraceae bacterium]